MKNSTERSKRDWTFLLNAINIHKINMKILIQYSKLYSTPIPTGVSKIILNATSIVAGLWQDTCSKSFNLLPLSIF